MTPEYNDMLGKTIKIGQTCINLFFQSVSGEPIGHRIYTIKKINGASVRIQYDISNGEFGESNIYNTTNRLIILEEGNGKNSLRGEEYKVKNRFEILDFGGINNE